MESLKTPQPAQNTAPSAQIDGERLKKLLKGERIGNVAVIICAALLAYFIVGFCVGTYCDIYALKLSTLIVAPVLAVAAVSVAAYCNVKFGGEIEKIINDYVRDVMIENAKSMHPERDSLTFYCRILDDRAEISVNNFKEKILFDFSAFKKLSAMRKSTVASAITTRICITFLKLALTRGAKYSSVSYTARADKANGKRAFIINDGAPDKKALKIYYKNK
ncbi:MAG: hypothetical protein K2L67_02985 [Clostridia bacterium]|nr:hypothetical protein [Clostridia bacterium]